MGRSPETPLESVGIGWLHRKISPLASPATTRGPRLDSFEIADGLYYTGVGEQWVGSMEMSCRMARQVAQMIF